MRCASLTTVDILNIHVLSRLSIKHKYCCRHIKRTCSRKFCHIRSKFSCHVVIVSFEGEIVCLFYWYLWTGTYFQFPSIKNAIENVFISFFDYFSSILSISFLRVSSKQSWALLFNCCQVYRLLLNDDDFFVTLGIPLVQLKHQIK